ncbi:MAG: hypothetical protein KBE41_02500 [Lutibacter sp.]|nr:hypothetical protein [Lutibacter sp.]MBP9600349.1 hypothetical protein [Lutibacter sp.]
MKKAVLSLLMVICFVTFTNAQQKEGAKKETSKEVKACCADKKESAKKECKTEAKKTCATEPKKACCAGSKK